jgi:hypothetical protein
MSEVFTHEPDLAPCNAVLPGSLCHSPVGPKLIPECADSSIVRTAANAPLHDGKWWAEATKGFDFRQPDALNSAAFNRILWQGVIGDRPYPSARSGHDFTKDCPGVCNCEAPCGRRTVVRRGQHTQQSRRNRFESVWDES